MSLTTPFFPGYPKTFATKIGLIESGLGGSCASGDPVAPGNDQEPQPEEAKEDDDSDAPLGDTAEGDKKPAAKKKPPPPPPPKSTDKKVEELSKEFEGWTLVKKNDDMQIKTIYLKNVPVRNDVVGNRDVLAVQCRLNGGADLSTFKCHPQRTNPNLCKISCDVDPNVSKGVCRVREQWIQLNFSLAKQIEAGLDEACEADTVEDEDYERDTDTFNWPHGLKSTLNPIDPYVIGFRAKASDFKDSLYEIDRVNVKGKDGITIVPCFVITGFFYVATPTKIRETGDLKLPRRIRPVGPAAKRNRVEEDGYDSIDDLMEDVDSGGGGGGKPKASPKPQSRSFLNIMTFGLFF